MFALNVGFMSPSFVGIVPSIEMVIYNVVSATVLPGLQGNPELEAGPEATEWWREHGRTAPPPVPSGAWAVSARSPGCGSSS